MPIYGGEPGKFAPETQEELARKARRETNAPTTNLPTSKKRSVQTELLRTISDMGFREEDLEQVPRTVRNLTVADLEDFARKMAGVPQHNPAVNRLTIEDIQGIEYLFGSTKQQALEFIAGRNALRLEAIDIDVSCCCCTPCCCCAATEVDPFAA
jgi:hypothetical protein